MKKLLFIIATLFISATTFSQVSTCCPKFDLKLMGEIMPCHGDSTCAKDPVHGGGNPIGIPGPRTLTACKNTAQTYYVIPNLPGFTFNWTVVGGTPAVGTGNPMVITWGNGTGGMLQVIISDASGNCRDTIRRKVCLLDAPVASFTVAPSTTVCANSTPLIFSNTSVGANSYTWNFGDGTWSNVFNPPPKLYTTAGVYTVLLTVSNGTGGSAQPGIESRCGCTDTASIVITVLAGTGPTITSPNCKKMLCPKDTVTYCVSPGCAPYNWTINGGSIIGSNGNCVTVQWDATPPLILPASVSVTTGCGGPCGNAATLNVPVLWNNMLISGPNPVCVGTASTYSLPVMPGTFYNWTVTGAGGGTITGPNQNTASINVFWSGPPGTATITCNYNNPYSGCSGTSTRTISVRNKFTATGPAVVCTGTAAAYNSNGPANWVISPVSGFTVGSLTNVSSINVNWTIPGAYTITSTATNPANFCNNNAVINVVVNQTPILNLIVGPTSICPGSFYTYSVSSNLIGPFVWTTSAGGTVISQMGANNDSVIIQWTGTGPHSITVSQTVNGCKGLKTLSPINNVPAVSITGPASVCRDQTPNPQYTASGGLPAGSYTWSISPAAAGTITGGQGTNQINVLWSGGVAPGTSSATVNVVVCNYPAVNYPVTITTPANVTVTKTSSLCTMPGVTLSVSPSLPCYQWYLNGVAISGATSATYVATTHGYYEVKCPTQCSGYGGIFVPREYIPNVTISTTKRVFCTTEPISTTLFSAASGGCSYSWFRNNVLVAGPSAINTPLNVTTVGSYYQVVTCGNCKDTSNTIVVYTQVCGTTPGCDLSFNPSLFNGQQNMGGPAGIIEPVDKSLLAATLNINPPSSFCNNVQFSANMSFTSPHSLSSGIFWNFGDGGTFSTTASGVFTPPHTYTSVGIYVVTASINVDCPPPPTPNICPLTDTIHYVVPIAANFSSSVNCNKIYLTDLSTVLSPCTIATYSWSATGPGSVSFSNPAAASPLLTVGASGTYNVTLTVTSSCNGCVATITLPVIITLPTATFTVPSPVCAGTPVAFNAPAGMSNYLWNFGDGFTSSLQNTTHTFDLTPTNPTITLTVSNAFGCVATASNTITVNPPPALTVTPLQMICPGLTATITATGAGFNNYAFYQNGTLVQSGASFTYTTGIAGTYYVIASTTGGGCVVKSALTYVFHYPNPVAKIMGSSVACLSGGSATIYLYNAVNNPTSTYSWNLQGNVTVLSTNYNLFTTVNAVGNYSYIITVTDSSGCIARDTLCVVVANSPVVTVVPSTSGAMCAGVIHSFIASATPPNPNYIYLWSNGVTGTTMSTTLAGNYSVTVTNPANGCSGFGFAGTINPRPSTILFPIGCDTLCPKDSIIPPLALGGPIVPGGYTVQWFLNGNYASPFFTGPVLNIQANMPPLIFGMNNISIVVTYNGCSDTSKAYNLFIESCDCDCEESHWGEIQLNEGDHPGAKTANVGNPTGGTPIILNCGVAQKLDCNKTYTINSTYFCKDSICSDSVTYSLQPPTGPAITGSIPAPLTFTVTQSGTYTLTMYGWCGDKICDSCVIKFVVDCKKCDCKGSKWDKITLTPGKPIYDDHEDNPASAKIGIPNPNTNPTPTPNPVNLGLNCGKTYKLDCNKPYTLNANYLCKDSACAGKVTFSLQPPTGLPITGTLPPGYTFTPTQSGVYTLTMYGWCDTVKCDSCIIYFEVKCSCDCSGSKWGEKYYTIDNVTKQINCNKEKPDEVKVKCNKPITVNANYNCVGVNCKSDVTYTLQPPIGLPTSGSLPITFTPSLPGTYTLTMYGWCDGKICDSCVVKFITDCVKDSSCCPYEIKIKQAPSIQTSVINNPAATVANGNFTFTGPTGNLFTEVRAQVVSYNLYSNFNNECLNCKSYPFSWASIYQPGLIGSMPPQITMFNAVTNAFNPAGAGMYQNPREVIWSSATPFALPSNINISFLLPPSSIIDCCELTAKICVKFTFRNNDCKECEVIVCFEVPIKKK